MAEIKRFRLKPREVEETPSPIGLDQELFQKGYEHGLVSNVLTDFRKSFRFGFRKAKIEQYEKQMSNISWFK